MTCQHEWTNYPPISGIGFQAQSCRKCGAPRDDVEARTSNNDARPADLRRAATISTSCYWAGVFLTAADEIERQQAELATLRQEAQRLRRERDEYKTWWERDSGSLSKVLNQLSLERACKEDFRAARDRLRAALERAVPLLELIAGTRGTECASPRYQADKALHILTEALSGEPAEKVQPDEVFWGLDCLDDDGWRPYLVLYRTREAAERAKTNALPLGSEWRVVTYRRNAPKAGESHG